MHSLALLYSVSADCPSDLSNAVYHDLLFPWKAITPTRHNSVKIESISAYDLNSYQVVCNFGYSLELSPRSVNIE